MQVQVQGWKLHRSALRQPIPPRPRFPPGAPLQLNVNNLSSAALLELAEGIRMNSTLTQLGLAAVDICEVSSDPAKLGSRCCWRQLLLLANVAAIPLHVYTPYSYGWYHTPISQGCCQ